MKNILVISFLLLAASNGFGQFSDSLNSSTKYEIIDFSISTDIKIDTTIFIDGTIISEKDTILNDTNLFKYYSKFIISPKHYGDPNYATVSIIIDTNGFVINVHIIEDVLNRFGDEPWKLSDDSGFKFSPIVNKGKALVTEYQIKALDICYCVPLIEKNQTSIETERGKRRKRRLSKRK